MTDDDRTPFPWIGLLLLGGVAFWATIIWWVAQ